jgi:hypothetical protein
MNTMDLAPVPKPLVWPVAASAAAFSGLVGVASGSVVPFYYPLILAFGAFGFRHGAALARGLQTHLGRWPFWGMVAAGYAGVVVEETIAGLLHGIYEGAGLPGLVRSAGQFIFFNLFAFTGIILSLAFWRTRISMARWDLFVIAGGWGLFAEGSLWALMANPVAGGLLILPNMAVYAVILWPMMLACPPAARGGWQPHWPLRYGMIWAMALALSLPAVAAVTVLRGAHPAWFPDCAYIACR